MGARGPKTIDPTPAEIQHCTAKIRSRWSERTHRLRAGWTVEAADKMNQWTAPVIHLGDAWQEGMEDDEFNPFLSN
jgi:hypothetical protein